MSRPSSRSLPLWFEHVAVLAGFILLAVGLSFPLVTQFGDHIPGVEGDVWSYLWAMGWARVSVLDLGVNPFHTDYIYYPLGGATQLLWGTALPSFASIPLQLAFGLVPAFNLTYLAASVLTGYGMYLLVKSELRFVLKRNSQSSHPEANVKTRGAVELAAFVAGVCFAFGALRLGYGLAFTNLFHTEFIPFYVFFLLRATRTRGWKDPILAGVFFAANVYVDFQIAAFLAVLTGLWFLVAGVGALLQARDKNIETRGAAARHEEDARAPKGVPSVAKSSSLVARWLVIIAVAGILSLPMLGFVLNDFAIEGGNYIRVFPFRYSSERSYDLLSYVLPNGRSSLYQALPTPRLEGVNALAATPDESDMSPDRQSFLGLATILLALVGAVRFRRALFFWLIVTVFFALLSFGPVLHVLGINTGIEMPFALANNIPILNHIRIPMRYGVMVFFSVALLAGAGAFVLLDWRRWLVVPILIIVVAEAAVLPFPSIEFRIPPIYEQIAQEPGDFTILEIPSFYWRLAAKNEVYQAIHQKRILRAYTNRIAPEIADYFSMRQTPIVVRSLRALEGAEDRILPPDEIVQDRDLAEETVRFFNLRYAILHRDELDADRVAQIDTYLRDVLKAKIVSDDGTVIAYALPQPSAPHDNFELGLEWESSLMYLGRGWQTEPVTEVEGVRGRSINPGASELFLPHSTGARQLDLFTYSPLPNQMLRTDVNGQGENTLTLDENWKTYALPLTLPERLNVLRFISALNQPDEHISIGSVETKSP